MPSQGNPRASSGGYRFAASLLLLIGLTALAAAARLAVRLTEWPLDSLAGAADALRASNGGTLLEERGPREATMAALAFNATRQRLESPSGAYADPSCHLARPAGANQRMKLRTELIAEPALRSKPRQSQRHAVARSAQARHEAPRAVDLNALPDGFVCDAVDAEHVVGLVGT